jgi:hypothetical protein
LGTRTRGAENARRDLFGGNRKRLRRSAADEAIGLAREQGIGSALLYALLARAQFNATDPDEALELLDEATTVVTTLGDYYAAAAADDLRETIATRAGEWRIALQSFVRAATDTFATDETLVPPEEVLSAAIALAHLGDLENAAVMFGFCRYEPPDCPRRL